MTATDTTRWLDGEPSAPPRATGSPGFRTRRRSRDRAIRTEVVSVHRPPTSGLRAWSARHPVTTFLVLAFAIAYPVMSVPILADHGVIPDGWMPQSARAWTPSGSPRCCWSSSRCCPPRCGSTWAADGPTGVRVLVRRMFRWRIGARWWLLVLAGLPTLTLAWRCCLGDTFKPVDVAPFVVAQLVGLLVNLAPDQHVGGDRMGRRRADPAGATPRTGHGGPADGRAVRAGPHAAALHRRLLDRLADHRAGHAAHRLRLRPA